MYGGAQTMVLLMRLKHGDIYNSKTLHEIQDMTFEMNALPGVNHNEIFSLASLRNVYAKAEPGAIISTCFMYPFVPETQADIDKLKKIVDTHRESITPFVNYDNKGAVITASFVEDKLDYKALFEGIQDIIKKHSDDNTEIYVAGLPVVAGWGYYYLPRITLIFVVSIVLMLIDSLYKPRPAQQLVGANPDRIILGDMGSGVHEPDGLQLRPRHAGHPFHPDRARLEPRYPVAGPLLRRTRPSR